MTVVVCRGAKRVKVLRAPSVETKNPFIVLEEGKEKEVDTAGGGKKEGADAVTLPQGRVLVFGDSQVRHLDSVFCARDRKRRSRLCLPGTGIGKVAYRLDMCLENDWTKPIVFSQCGRE